MDTSTRRRIIGLMILGVTAVSPACAHGQQRSERATSSDQARPTGPGPADLPNPAAKHVSTAQLEARARAREVGDRQDPINEMPRTVHGKLSCPDVDVVEYDGAKIAYNQPIEVTPDFRRRLMRFETIVAEVAIDVYGRPPDRIVHAGGFVCKTVGHHGKKLSEHAFGHAIDIAGVDFDALEDNARTAEVSGAARKAFSVRLRDHWDADDGFGAKHRAFLHRLADTLEQRGPFSTMLGPSYPGHDRLFHFDFGPQFFFRL